MGGINHQKWMVYYCYTSITICLAIFCGDIPLPLALHMLGTSNESVPDMSSKKKHGQTGEKKYHRNSKPKWEQTSIFLGAAIPENLYFEQSMQIS